MGGNPLRFRRSKPGVGSRGERTGANALLLSLAGIALLLAPAGSGTAMTTRADLPPLIPRKILFGNPVKTAPQLSPDGTRLSYLAPSENGVLNVWVVTPGKQDDKPVTRETHRPIGNYFWAYDSRHILYTQDSDGDENNHLYSFDLESNAIRDLTPFQGITVANVLTDKHHPNEILVGLNLRDRRLFDMYRVDLTTGAVTLEAQNPGDVLSWTTDADFVIRAATVFTADTNTVVRVRDSKDSPWRDLITIPFEEGTFWGQVNGGSIIAGFSADGKGLYVASPLGSDTSRLVKLDTTTGKELEVIASDPKSDVDATGANRPRVLLNPDTFQVQAVGFYYLKPEWKVVDPGIQEDFRVLGRTHPGVLNLDSRDNADAKWIVSYTVDDGPTAFYLYDRAGKQAQLLYEDQPDLARYQLSKMKPVTFTARDGFKLVAYLTLPVGVPPKNLPLVLFPHGGPWFRDFWGLDPIAQLLANRGYAVLQVEFRGSIGFGKKYLNASTHEWGVGKMQHDLTDGVQWAIHEGIADPKRIAIMGGSYGGYATLSGITFTPELYSCAVDIVGPSDVAELFKSMPAYWGPVKKRWIHRTGDVENDPALNQRISPIYHVDAIRAPLLIGHGAHDPRVNIRNSEKIVSVMREKNLPVTYIVYPDEGHGFNRPENNLDFFGRVEEFLAKYLGGRAEPWEKVPGSTAEVH